jgi:hypothetical protein
MKTSLSKDKLKQIIKPENKLRFYSPYETFQNMLNDNYFTKEYQYNLNKLKNDSLEKYILYLEKIKHNLKDNLPKYLNFLLTNK